MLIFIFIVLALIASVYLFMHSPAFGRSATGERLQRIRASAHYRNGSFQNLSDTPPLTDGANYRRLLWEFFFVKHPRAAPERQLPAQKTDLRALGSDEDVLVWFGHSSYFLQADGKKILVDPVFSGHASPFSFTTKSFPGTDMYGVSDLPELDILFLSHDHWDHLDYKTLLQLKPKVKRIITGLGTAAHLERWGFDMAIVEERDWNEHIPLGDGFSAVTLPARHFSGRTFKRNQALWISLALRTPTMNIYLGGDSGYDTHFKEIGIKYGPFDLAILECGQYNRFWKYIHMMPEEVIQAGIDLRAGRILPVHWAKFRLGLHPWDEPIKRVIAEGLRRNIPVLHPMIGEKMNLKHPSSFVNWWEP
ncbi:MAG: MBL fold metallo-hydrolase [Chitinophagaceae bacterium]|nr:MBL fold metallo-hydrolase [Chitinophagaceae bacterium]